MYFDMFRQMLKTLGQTKVWLEKAAAHAELQKFDPNLLGELRLTLNQFPLSRQVQTACDTVKLGASRLTGKEAPSHPDTETTLEQLTARIDSVLAYLGTFTAMDFEKVGEVSVTQPRWEGKTMTGHDYFFEHVVPNFFFHVSHVYALLRHAGVPVGKRDYLGTLTQKLP